MKQRMTFEPAPPILPCRRRDAHKGDFGRLLIVGGSVGYTGAPVLAAQAAVCSGAGLVTVAVPEEIYPIVAAKCTEAMVMPISTEEKLPAGAHRWDAVLIGPGLGQSEGAERLVLGLMEALRCPVVVDADGLNVMARHIDILDERAGPTVLTPHEGEFARLAGCALPVAEREDAARAFALTHRCTLVLKGHRTVIASPDGNCLINPTGNPGMARGGSGDALAGLMVSLMAQKLPDPVTAAVWLHGRAGDLAAEDKGEYGMTIHDLIAQIPYAMKERSE